VDLANKWKYDPRINEKIPGINFNAKRVQIIATYEEYLRHGFKVRSKRALGEMNTFVYVNGRPDHQKGQHDDLIMSIAMACYVGESSFTQISKNMNQAKVMMESWQVNTNEMKQSAAFDPISIENQQQPRKQLTKDDYQNYSWLFRGM
jgi:hypothetical protein